MESPPYPLSSRAKPRDLQFYRPVLEMLFDRVLTQVEVKMCLRLRRSDKVGESMLSGPACRAGLTSAVDLRASKSRPCPLKTFPGQACRTADPSASLGMTKGRVALPCRVRFLVEKPAPKGVLCI